MSLSITSTAQAAAGHYHDPASLMEVLCKGVMCNVKDSEEAFLPSVSGPDGMPLDITTVCGVAEALCFCLAAWYIALSL